MSGFQSPNYTQTPNDLFDELLPEMGLSELKVVMCIVRHTFGYHKENIKLSIRAIARFTGLTAKSVMEGAEQAEKHGLIGRYQDGNKTTVWQAIVSVIPSNTPRDTRYHAGVIPSNTLVGVKETEIKNKEKSTFRDPMWDLLHGKDPDTEVAKGIEAIHSVALRLEAGLRRGQFPETPAAQKVYRWILEREAAGQSLEGFIAWAMDGKRAEFSFIYHKDPSLIKRDWPQVVWPKQGNRKASGYYG